jgi:hypothetical protein
MKCPGVYGPTSAMPRTKSVLVKYPFVSTGNAGFSPPHSASVIAPRTTTRAALCHPVAPHARVPSVSGGVDAHDWLRSLLLKCFGKLLPLSSIGLHIHADSVVLSRVVPAYTQRSVEFRIVGRLHRLALDLVHVPVPFLAILRNVCMFRRMS